VLQAIRRLLTRPECFRLERELPARVSTGESSAPWQGTHNNTVERGIRPIPLGRKNALFAGSDTGGERWAILASLINTAKLHGIDPQTYLADVLDRIVSGRTKANALATLLPWAWKAAHEQQTAGAA
jgi:transposase IS66-like protein/transposase IS66 family protein